MTEKQQQKSDHQPKSMITFQKLAQDPQFVDMLKHANSINLDTKQITKQIQNMSDAGYTLDAIKQWFYNMLTTATNQIEKEMRAQGSNQGQQLTVDQLAGQEPRYSESNMAPGSYFSMRPTVHVATQVEIILITFAELLTACLDDPKGVNPYNYRLISLNRFLDKISEKQYFNEQGVPKEMPTGKMEEIETTDETTGKKVKSQLPETVPSPHYSLIQKKKKAEVAGKYQPHDAVEDRIAGWMKRGSDDGATFEEDNKDWLVTEEERNHFKENMEIIRKNFQAILRDMSNFQYADVRNANTIHHASQVPKNPKLEPNDVTKLKQDRKREYEANQVVITKKGSAFLRMYMYCWNQADQRGIYGNFIMMGLDKNLTW